MYCSRQCTLPSFTTGQSVLNCTTSIWTEPTAFPVQTSFGAKRAALKCTALPRPPRLGRRKRAWPHDVVTLWSRDRDPVRGAAHGIPKL
eukprot:2555372-Rhodomonas_salina.3